MACKSPSDIRTLFAQYTERIDKRYGIYDWQSGVFGNFLPKFMGTNPSISEFLGCRQDERIVLGIPTHGETLSVQYARTIALGKDFFKAHIASEELKRSLPTIFQASLTVEENVRLTVFSSGDPSLVMRVPEYVNMIARDITSHNLLELQCKNLLTAKLDLRKLQLDDWPIL